MGENYDDGLGLSLSLSLRCPEKQQKSSFNVAFQSSFDLNAETRSYIGGIDVNLPATMADCEEDNSTVSSVGAKRSERDSSSAGIGEEEDGGDTAAAVAGKKLRLSKDQSAVLEETFKEHNSLNPKQKFGLAKQLNLRPRQVEVWFQNRRARTKLKQTEVESEYLKQCCENLTVENRRLQKEVNELRALKLSPQFYTNMNPPTTLTICPECKRVANSPIAESSALATTGGHHQQRSMSINPWATITPHQPLDASHGRRP